MMHTDELWKDSSLYEARQEDFSLGEAAGYPVLDWKTCRMFRICSLTYEKDFPRQEAFENVVAAFNRMPCRLFYYLRGKDSGVEFYIGVVPNNVDSDRLDTNDYAEMLGQSFRGNFPGSELAKIEKDEARGILQRLCSVQHYSTLLGVPSRSEEHEEVSFQGLDRVVNIMTSGRGKDFHFIVVWEPVGVGALHDYELGLQDAYRSLSLIAHFNVQAGEQKGTQGNITYNKSRNENITKGNASDRGHSEQARSGSAQLSRGSSESSSVGAGTSEGINISKGDNVSSQFNLGQDIQNKSIQDRMKYVDEELLPRVRHGIAKGMFRTAVYVGASTALDHQLLQNTIISICQGDKPSFTPMYPRELTSRGDVKRNEAAQKLVASFSIRRIPSQNLRVQFDSRPVINGWKSLATWLTSAEISMLAGLPLKEVPGLELREQVDFGLNVPPSQQALPLGYLMQEGRELKGRLVSLDRKELKKHTFVAGTTGSGKTTTCLRLLVDAASQNMPFMVIEPAKTEYRRLLDSEFGSSLIVFTAGKENGAPFRLNPFEFLPTESISSRADLLKACFLASFDMEAAIPNLLEEGLYRCYELYGWDLSTDENCHLANRLDAWKGDGRFFPTISDYIREVLSLVDEKGFDSRLANDYKGSIRARLDSLRAGSKGLMFDTPRSVDFMDLIDRNVVIELEELKSGEDKSFFMGLVLGCLNEALKARHHGDSDFQHITLVEEAHRLLAKPSAGSSSRRTLGVEMFTDMLAEVRKYGECLVIIDQIPSKLAPEVLKNTGTKILHKLFARDDKDAVGDTMALSDKQKNSLSNLLPGQAVIFSGGWKKPVSVMISQSESLCTEDDDIDPHRVKEAGRTYWEGHPELFSPGVVGRKWKLEDLVRINDIGKRLIRTLKNDKSDPSQLLGEMKKLLGADVSRWLVSILFRETRWTSKRLEEQNDLEAHSADLREIADNLLSEPENYFEVINSLHKYCRFRREL